MFASEKDEVIVLEEGKDTEKRNCYLEFTESGKTFFELNYETRYNYWFDIVTLKNKSKVLAYYNLALKKSGIQKLKERSIPSIFPAIIKNSQYYTSYYFAGDFTDVYKVPAIYNSYGLDKFKQLFSISNQYANDAFYWKVYVPVMEKILENEYYKKSIQVASNISPSSVKTSLKPQTELSVKPTASPIFTSDVKNNITPSIDQPMQNESIQNYTVQAGDSLSEIAKIYLGDENKWQEIYDLNKDIITDPDIIEPGMSLRLPSG